MMYMSRLSRNCFLFVFVAYCLLVRENTYQRNIYIRKMFIIIKLFSANKINKISTNHDGFFLTFVLFDFSKNYHKLFNG